MKAGETTFQRMVEGEKQFAVPLYQRPYAWQREHLQRLWDDVLEQADALEEGADPPPHFLGSVVLAPESAISASGLGRWVVVDGQQRLTTLMLLLAALRDHLTTGAGEAERVEEQFLINKWKRGDERYRLLPTQTDRAEYIACIDRRPDAGGPGNVGEAYRFFRAALVEVDDPADPHDIARIETVVRERITLVEITVERGDNVFRIFESLNNTGMALSQADLVRNEIFMRLPKSADDVYRHTWLPMQQMLGADRLEQLMYLDLILEGEDRARRDDLYRRHRERLSRLSVGDENSVKAYVDRLAARGQLVATLIDPAGEPDPGVREAMRRINDWSGLATYPTLLALLEHRRDGHASGTELVTATSYIESFLVRRMLCGVTSANLNRIFQALAIRIREATGGVAAEVRTTLSGPRLYWPTDSELREAFRSRPFYWTGRPAQRMFVLRRLEATFPSSERADLAANALSIEHVMPQSLPDEWLAAVASESGDEPPRAFADRLVHTIGNLTLTGYNSQLGNASFKKKRPKLAESNLEMTRPIANSERWGAKEIRARGDDLAARAIALWPAPDESARSGMTSGRDWTQLLRALSALPPGAWTTYGDLAELVGSHPVPVGTYVANNTVPQGWRVLSRDGQVSPGFHWSDPDDRRDPHDVLRSEGVEFDDAGRASPAQRLRASELLALIDPSAEVASLSDLGDAEAQRGSAERFMLQIGTRHGPTCAGAVVTLMEMWEALGGQINYGTADVTTGHFVLPRDAGNIWPLSMYPGSTVEVVFQYLKTRPPFDSLELRDELRQRLCRAPEIDLPRAKLDLRPSFPIGLLADSEICDVVADTLLWFTKIVRNEGSA